VEFEPARRTTVELSGGPQIADNIVIRAARDVMQAMRTTGRVRFHLTKRIPLGAGLGGGSSDAAAVLLALPVLAGRELEGEELISLAAQLGSDVPFSCWVGPRWDWGEEPSCTRCRKCLRQLWRWFARRCMFPRLKPTARWGVV
jgi:4-diphosphocytidyl-2-C-methyl-D-erythritol kinase